MQKKMTMNEITGRLHAAVINSLSPSYAFVDACDVNEERYGNMIKGLLKKDCNIISEHKAETKYQSVAAASIVAKVERDRIIEELSEEYGVIGSGYPSDPITIRFLESYIKENKTIPIIARSSWNTVSDIRARLAQSSLEAFIH
jgi:ribonuclease HII